MDFTPDYSIEPDFNFELFPKHKIIDEDPDVIYVKPGHEFIDVSADWIVNLWHDGALTANSFSVAMDRKDITQLRDYLRTILKGDTKINLFLFLHTIIWAIAGICLWSLVSIVILRDIGWMLTFAEYAAFFPGFIGGIMFLWSHDKK